MTRRQIDAGHRPEVPLEDTSIEEDTSI